MTIGRSLFDHPALSVAYPKSLTPSVVSGVSWPVALSRSTRFPSRMKTERLPSGDVEVIAAAAPRPPRPRPRPPVAELAVAAQAGSVQGAFVPVAGSTRTASLPVDVVTRYQNRSPAIQFGLTAL